MDQKPQKFGDYPPDMESLPSDHEFYKECASLIEKFEGEANIQGEEMDKEELLYHMQDFVESWFENLSATGTLW